MVFVSLIWCLGYHWEACSNIPTCSTDTIMARLSIKSENEILRLVLIILSLLKGIKYRGAYAQLFVSGEIRVRHRPA